VDASDKTHAGALALGPCSMQPRCINMEDLIPI
jgi:hypothetical protein